MKKKAVAYSAEELERSPCPNKSLCGSCSWSHIEYPEQLKTKLGEIQKALSDVEAPPVCDTILPSPVTEHYRNRMDFTIDFEGRLGLRQKGKWWRTIDGHHCFLSHCAIERVFHIVHAWLPEANLSYFDRKKHTGLLRYASIRATASGETLLTIITSTPSEEEQESLNAELEKLARHEEITTLVHGINETNSDTSTANTLIPIKGNGVITEKVGNFQFLIDSLSFFQSNSYGAEVLLNKVLDLAKPYANKRIVDLYCGSGFFTIPLAAEKEDGAKSSVYGVEIVSEAIQMAEKNTALNNIKPTFEAAKSEESLWEDLRPELLIVDPPRSGTHPNALKKIIASNPEAIIYISCNYREFAKDMTKLSEKFTLTHSVAIDMFPHTPHVELVSLLERK